MQTNQYYYKNDSCKAKDPYHDDCICWWDQGTGPFADAIPGEYSFIPLEWRLGERQQPNPMDVLKSVAPHSNLRDDIHILTEGQLIEFANKWLEVNNVHTS